MPGDVEVMWRTYWRYALGPPDGWRDGEVPDRMTVGYCCSSAPGQAERQDYLGELTFDMPRRKA